MSLHFFGHVVSRVGHSAEAVLLSGDGASTLVFEVVHPKADGTASFELSARLDEEIKRGKLRVLEPM
eukprot:2961005-Pleurochrysis_carterae.AAC.1